MVHAVSRVTPVPYAEIVASIASRSAGPGTRANIDEFTETTAHAIEAVGGAERGKAIIILNPVSPPMIMRDTVFCAIGPDVDRDAISESIHRDGRRRAAVRARLPTAQRPAVRRPDTRLWHGNGRVAVFLEVKGNGDYLPEWAGNLDIMTAAAVRAGELICTRRERRSDEHDDRQRQSRRSG